MFRADHSTKLTDANGVGKDGYTEGNPGTEAATVLTAEAANALQEEVATVVEGAGLDLDKADSTQLNAVIASIRAVAGMSAVFANISAVDDTAGQEYLAIGEGNGDLLAVGKTGLIALSTNHGDTWTEQTPAAAFAGDFHAVAYSSLTGWVIAGTSGEIQTSPDGVTWTHRTAGSSYSGTFKGAATGPLQHIALVGNAGEIQTSADGVTWTRRQNGGANFISIHGRSTVYWLAVRGDGNIYRSTADATWTLVLTSGGLGGYIDHSSTNFDVVYQGSDADNFWISEDDGVTWTQYALASFSGGAKIIGGPHGTWLQLTATQLFVSGPDVKRGLWYSVLLVQARMGVADAPAVGFVTRFGALGFAHRLFLLEPGGDQLWASGYAPND